MATKKEQSNVQYHISTAKTKKAKEGRSLEITYKKVTTRDNGKTSVTTISEASDDMVHPDLTKALKAFLPHFLLLSDNANINDFKPSYFSKKEFETKQYPFEVTGVHIKEKDDSQHVIIVGRKNLKSGKGYNIVVPMVNFQPFEDDEDAYPLHEQLQSAVTAYLEEVSLFMEGKVGSPDQLDMFDDNVKTLNAKTA